MNNIKNPLFIGGAILITVFAVLFWNYTEAIKGENALERERLEQQAQLEREKLQQQKEMEEARLETERVLIDTKIQAEKDAAQLKVEQQAKAAEDAKIEKYRAECKAEKKLLMADCNLGLNGYIKDLCGEDESCIQAEIAKNPFCPKPNYDAVCLDRKMEGLSTYETAN